MKNRKSLFCLLLVLMLFIGIGTASAQGPGGLETNEDNAYVTTSTLNTVSNIAISSSPCNSSDNVLVITYGVSTYSTMTNLADTLINLGYNVTHLTDPANGSITSTMNSGTFEQVWFYDGEPQLSLNDTDAQTIADWYNNTARGNIIVDARSYGAYYNIAADAPLIENIAKAFGLRCENGLWIGTDHDNITSTWGWTHNGNKLLSTIGYATVTGIQNSPVVAGNTSAELLSTPNVVVPSTLHAHASPGIAPNGTQYDGIVLERLLWNAVDNKTLTSYSLTTNFCDNTSPVITLLGSDPVTIEVGSIYNDTGATACDYVDGNLTGSIVMSGSVDNTTIGTYSITYDVNDSSNNSAVQITRSVHVNDTTPPVISSPPDKTVLINGTDNITWTITDLLPNQYWVMRNGTQFVSPTNYTSGDVVNVSVDTTTEGMWNYTICANDSSGNTACDEVIVTTIIEKVSFDIKPGSCPNPLNLKSKGVLPVAILGTADFDVTTIDVTTITLSHNGSNGSVSPIRYALEDVATPFDPVDDECCHDLDGDGFMDLTLKFDTQELIGALDLNECAGETISLTITANIDGSDDWFEASDCLRILEKNKIK